MIKPEHIDDINFITRAIFQHELSTKKVYNERDLVRDYYKIHKQIEEIYDDIDINKMLSTTIY
jgi:hypothetical protein